MSEDEDFVPPEPFPWELEFWDIARAFRERAEREGKPENTYPEIDPDKKLTVADVFAYVRACKAHPEIWNANVMLKRHREQEYSEGILESTEEETWNHYLTLRFQRWYAFKHLPGYNPYDLIVGDIVVVDVIDGRLDDPFGDEARSAILEIGEDRGIVQ
ncbi:hypothetical protein [Hoeflea prorocentri]|uniref:Uncharacterized protein n=1 Tax=Hoeflea prorocentri TaxID=1922333 RepID=A0A9X3UGR9_9HYPH|nr:hypothetical protein [Hoeflea prorocentri]MCY6381017.1 hypothetical protein [Hoeflea prorocentri]MDA5398817.1 hypothetical protein [Hoeflea prorocentri]